MAEFHSIQVPTIDITAVLSTIVCGVDGSAEAAEAVRQAAVLAEPDARIELVGVIHAGLVESVASVMPAPTAEPERRLRKEAWVALAHAAHDVPSGIEVTTTLRTGPVAALLAVEAMRLEAGMIAVGSHGQGRRLTGKLLGGVTTRLVHDTTCSLLIARAAPIATFPRTIVVGVDESEPSRRALAVAHELSRRTGAVVDPVHALDGSPAAALIERATAEDLLVVGSRGLRGLRARGSVSQAVANRAAGSVLVVR